MSMTVELSDEVAQRLGDEAERLGLTADQVATELLSAHLPTPRRHRLSFIGIAASGRTGPLDIHRERSELAARKQAEGS